MQRMRALGFLTLLALLTAGAPCAALAQNAQPPAAPLDARQLGLAMTRYYERPVDIPNMLVMWEKLGRPGPESMIGFLAGLFTKHPDKIATAIKTPLELNTQVFIVAGLRLANRTHEAKAAGQQWGWSSEQIASITPVEPLATKKVATAGHFDVMWAASFATGDATYVRPIYEFFADFASQPGVDVRDAITMVMVKHGIINRDAVKDLAKKYPQETFVRIAHASSALWSLESNARQHKFVAAALEQYAKQQPQNAAIKAIDEVRKARPQ